MTIQPVRSELVAGQRAVNLMSDEIFIRHQGFDLDERDGTTTISLALEINGDTPDAMWDNVQRIQVIIDDIPRMARSGQVGASFIVGLGGSQVTRYWVTEAQLDGIGDVSILLTEVEPVLTLTCLRDGEGDAVMLPESPVITNGDGSLIHIPDVPGSADGLVRLYLSDESTGGATINRIRIGRVAGHDLTPDDYALVLPAEATGDGTDESDAAAIDGSFARVTAGTTWRTFAKTTLPTDTPGMMGRFNVLPRIRDHAAVVPSPSDLAAIVTPEGGIGRRSLAYWDTGTSRETSITPQWGRSQQSPGNEELLTTLIDSFLLAIVVNEGATVTPPAGWTAVPGFPISNTNGIDGSIQISVFYIEGALPRTGGEAFAFSATNWGHVTLEEYVGVASNSALDAYTTDVGTSAGPVTTGSTGVLGHGFGMAVLVAATATQREGNEGTPGTSGRLSAFHWSSMPDGWSGFYNRHPRSGHNDPLSQGYSYLRAQQVYTDTTALSESVSLDDDAPSARWAAGILTFRAMLDEPPTIQAGLYEVRIASVDADGNESIASTPLMIDIPSNGAAFLEWRVANGDVAGHAVYVRRDGIDWIRHESGPGGQFLLIDMEANEQDPVIGGVLNSQIRAMVGMGSGTVVQDAGTFVAERSNGVWETERHLTMPLPPEAPLLGDDGPMYQPSVIRWQAKNDLLTVDVDMDGVWLFPADDPSVTLEFHGMDGWHTLDTPRVWRYDLRPDGDGSCVLLDNQGDEAGRAHVTGGIDLRHGDNYLIVELSGEGGESDTADLKVQLVTPSQVIPAFRGLRGSF